MFNYAEKDIYHDCVKIALEKEGWVVTDDPLDLSTGMVELLADLGAERWLEAENQDEKIAIEIKGFKTNLMSEFHKALGQYENYRFSLKKNEPDRLIYLAIPILIWDSFFQRPFVQEVIEDKNIKLIIFEPETQTIIQWKK